MYQSKELIYNTKPYTYEIYKYKSCKYFLPISITF